MCLFMGEARVSLALQNLARPSLGIEDKLLTSSPNHPRPKVPGILQVKGKLAFFSCPL